MRGGRRRAATGAGTVRGRRTRGSACGTAQSAGPQQQSATGGERGHGARAVHPLARAGVGEGARLDGILRPLDGEPVAARLADPVAVVPLRWTSAASATTSPTGASGAKERPTLTVMEPPGPTVKPGKASPPSKMAMISSRSLCSRLTGKVPPGASNSMRRWAGRRVWALSVKTTIGWMAVHSELVVLVRSRYQVCGPAPVRYTAGPPRIRAPMGKAVLFPSPQVA